MSSKLATSNLSLRQLRAFVAVAQESSMTRAAARLHLTPSALSMLVRAMEDDLGVRLFERTTRRLVLTAAGQQFLPTVERVFAELEQG
jgi:DNA-binding transcriptional LysR family regulator